MAGNNTTFHAKITADARQFIEQVESASQSLQGLISAYGQAGKKASSGAAKASGGAQDAKKEVKDVFSVAKQEQQALHQAALQNEQELAAARKRSREVSQDDAFGEAGARARAKVEQRAEDMRQKAMDDRLKDHRTYSDAYFDHITRSTAAERRSDLEQQQAIKRRLMDVDKMNKAHRAAILEDRRINEQNARAIAHENRKALDAMVTGRYALYDMANAYRGVYDVAQRVTRELVGTVMVAAQFESAFTSVERALQLESGTEAFNTMRQTLIDLSTEIPVAFAQISEIATLGAQMGVSAENITSFTKTIASFSATAGVTVDEAAEKFGRISSLLNVPIADFENLGAAVLFAGYNAVATEAEILSMTQSIAASANTAGLAADETVGLATALASLGLAPELSRGSLQRIFAELNRAAAGTSGKLDEFARLLGVTSEEAKFLWQEDPSQFFTSMLESLSGMQDLTLALDELGIVNIRDVELITRLSQNIDVFGKSMSDAQQAYADGTALAENYAKVADNLESKMQILANAFAELQDALAGSAAEGLKPFLDALTDALKGASEFARSPLGQAILPIATALTTAVAAFAGFNYITNIATAQILAMRVAMVKMNEMTGAGTFGFKTLYNQLAGNVYMYQTSSGAIRFMTKAQIEAGVAAGKLNRELADQALAAGAASGATRALAVSMRLLSMATTVGVIASLVGILLEASGALDGFRGDINRTEDDLKELGAQALQATGGLGAIIQAAEASREIGAVNSSYKTLVRTIEDVVDESAVQKEELDAVRGEMAKTKDELVGTTENQEAFAKAVKNSSDAIEDQVLQLGKLNAGLIADALGKVTYDEDGGMTSFFLEQIRNPEIARAAEILGFDIQDAIEAGMTEGQTANEYFERIKGGLEAIRTLASGNAGAGLSFISDGIMGIAGQAIPLLRMVNNLDAFSAGMENLRNEFGLTQAEVEELYNIIKENPDFNFDYIINGVDLIDGYTLAAREAYQANQELLNAGGTGETEQDIKSMTEAMRDYLALVTIGVTANQRSQEAFESLAQSIVGTDGAIYGLEESSRKNMAAFTSYVESAFAAAEANGEGGEGAILRVINAIGALGREGVNTAQMIDLFENIAVTELGNIGSVYAQLLTEFGRGADLNGLRSMLDGIMYLRWQASGFSSDVRAEWEEAIRFIESIDFNFDAGPFIKTTGTAVSALDKLKNALESTFKWANQQMGINSALRTLGQSLEENGKTFNIWRESGEENVGNLISVINELAERSGGNMQTFANYLASLRVALQQMGVGASGLRYIDAALEDTGKTGKATDSVVQRLTDSLMDIGSAEDEIMSVADAIDQVANAAISGIQARFSQAFAIDEITLGWLDMQDAAADAAEEVSRFEDQMASAREQIEDARLAIDEANASIQELTADRGKLEYQLSVALRYGDTLRAEQIRADLAKIDADIAREQDNIADANRDISDAQRDIRDAEQGIIDVRTQSTRETIEANRALIDMAERYATATAHMLVNAEEGADLNKIIDDQVEAFKQNAIEMGYTEEQAQAVADVLRDELIKSMEQIPENIETEINAETSAAMAAVNSFVADANRRLSQIDRNITITTTYQTLGAPPAGGTGGGFAYLSSGGLVTGPGTSTSDSIAARLSDGEYVVRAAAVEQYGVPFLNALNQQRVTPAMMSAPASTVVASGGVMSLSPEDRALLRAALDRPVALYTDNTVIAKSANAGNQILAQRGLK